MYSSTEIEESYLYSFIEAMFTDGFEAKEVIEICEDHEFPFTSIILTVHYYCLKHNRSDSFPINDVMASQLIQQKRLDWLK